MKSTMEILKKQEILNRILGKYKQEGKEFIYACPFCSHHPKKLSINLVKGVYKCWICCNSGKNLFKLVKKFGTRLEQSSWPKNDSVFEFDSQEEKIEYPKLPEEFVSLVNNDSDSAKPFLRYLLNRGVSYKDICYWRMGYCVRGQYANNIIIPSCNSEGEINFFVGRGINEGMKYNNSVFPKEKIVFNDIMIDFDSDVVLTEGVFDAVKAGNNAVPILGSTLNEDSLLFQKIVEYGTTVYLALDPDANKKQDDIIKKLVQYDIECYEIDIAPYKDAGEMSKVEFQKRKNEAKMITSDNLFSFLMEKRIMGVAA